MKKCISDKAENIIKTELERFCKLYVSGTYWDYNQLLADLDLRVVYKCSTMEFLECEYVKHKNLIYIDQMLSEKLRRFVLAKSILTVLIDKDYFKLKGREVTPKNYLLFQKCSNYILYLSLSMLVTAQTMEKILIKNISEKKNFIEALSDVCKQTPLPYYGADIKIREFGAILTDKGYGQIRKMHRVKYDKINEDYKVHGLI